METKPRRGTFALPNFLVSNSYANIRRIERRVSSSYIMDKNSSMDSPKNNVKRQSSQLYYGTKITIPEKSWNSEETAVRFIKRSALPRPPEPKAIQKGTSCVLPAPVSPRRKSVSFLIDEEQPTVPISKASKQRGSLPDGSQDFNKVMAEIEKEENATNVLVKKRAPIGEKNGTHLANDRHPNNMAAGSASSTVKSKNNQTKNKLTRQKSTPTTPSPKKHTTSRRRRYEKQPTYNENEVSLIIPGVHKGVKVDWNKGGRRKITRATPVKRAQNRSKSNSPERKRKKKGDDEPQRKEKRASPKKKEKLKPSATLPKTRRRVTNSPDLKQKNKTNSKTKSKKDNEKTPPLKTSPAKTSSAKTSPKKTSPAKTSPVKISKKASPAKTSPAKTPPVNSSSKKPPSKKKKSVSPKSKPKVNLRSPHVRRTACLNAGAILSAIYEPIRPKSNASSVDSSLTGKKEPEVQKAKRGRPKDDTTKTNKKKSKKKDTDEELQFMNSVQKTESSVKDGNDSEKKMSLKSRKDSKDKTIEKSKKKSPARKQKDEDEGQKEVTEVTKKEKKVRKRKQAAENVVIDGPTAKRMASLNATAILQAAYSEETPTDSSKGKKKGKVSQSEKSSKSSSSPDQARASLTTSCTAVMVVSTRPSASVQPRQQAPPQPIVPFVPTPLGPSSRLQRPPVHAFSFASNSQCFTAPSVAAQASDNRPTFSLFNVPVHGAPVYDQISPCPQLRQRLYVQQQQQCWPQPLPFIRHDIKTNTNLACAFRPIAPQRHMVQRLGSAVQPHSHLVVGNILPTPHSVATPIQLQPRISPKPPSPVKQTPNAPTSASKPSSKSSSGSGKSTKRKRQSGSNDGSTPKRRPPEDNGSKKQCKWQWIGEPSMKMIPSHHAPLPTKSSNGTSSCGASPNSPHNSPMQLVKRKCYVAIQHKDGDIVRIRDCVLVKANRRKASAPFIAKVAALWEDENSREMMMSILWYYRPEQTEASHIPSHHKSEVFASRHADIANVQTIDDICHVLTKAQFCRFKKEQERLRAHLPLSMPVVPPGETCVKMPDANASPDTVFLCYRVYDVRAKRILKHPPRVAVDSNGTPPSSSSGEEK
ncbi:DgyrCDS8463 [Dimorphilus gyrociliatus]|uniref:DgyrCDS8463 n=1 Tax=Dimorphilus gyrociliatus TaxID=2664684 RepID=A0A7I8VVR2_9ANNE|nr:DgyrCDS8463 [Dimorphilus gyrociliatus]